MSIDSGSMKGISIPAVTHLEHRARLDALRGPPVSLVTQLPVQEDGRRNQPVIIRSNIKNGVRIENLQLPPGYPRHLWLSTNLADFVDHIRVFAKNVLIEKCSRYRCPRMAERKGHAYIWVLEDNGDPSKTIKRKLSAPDYILKVTQTNSVLLKRMKLLETVDDDEDFLSEEHEKLCMTIARLICQVYCHILYWHHDAFVALEALPHLNTAFKWFILFSQQFRLLEDSDLLPLQEIIARLYEVDVMADPNGSQVQDDDKRISSVSSSMYSDDVSKITTPTLDYNGDRLVSEHSIDLSAHR